MRNLEGRVSKGSAFFMHISASIDCLPKETQSEHEVEAQSRPNLTLSVKANARQYTLT
jgi:hypothetical protein